MVAVVVPNVTGDADSSVANLWIDGDGGTCTRSATPVAYDDASACEMPVRRSDGGGQDALENARSGDVVNIVDLPGGDDYAGMALGPLAKTVTFRAASGRPEIGTTIVACEGCTLRGLKFENRDNAGDDAWVCGGPPYETFALNGIVSVCSDNVTVESFEIDGLQDPGVSGNCPPDGVGAWQTAGDGVDNLVFRGGSIHGVYNAKDMNVDARGWTAEGIHFYDHRRDQTCDPDVHNECIYTPQAGDATFRNNLFEKCAIMALFFAGAPDTDSDRVTIEGNVFTHTLEGSTPASWHSAPCGLKIGAGPSRINGWVVRYNTFETAPCNDDLPAGATPGQWYGNLGAASCISGFVYHHNVGETCSGPDSVAVSPFVNDATNPGRLAWYADAPGNDFHLTAAAPAIGAGDPAAFPATDRDGVRRGNPPDAGAHEYVP